MWNQATKHHFRVVRCLQCSPDWYKVTGRAPVKSHTEANRHAKRYPGHEVVIIDVDLLEVEHRYHFEAIPELEDPPF